MPEPTEAAEKPLLRVLTPNSTPEEVAAIVAVFSAMGGGEAPEPAPRSTWASTAHRLRLPPTPGPGGWRASALPH